MHGTRAIAYYTYVSAEAPPTSAEQDSPQRRSHPGPSLHSEIARGKLKLRFSTGEGNEWQLGDKSDRLATARVSNAAREWAKSRGAREGQLKAIVKTLSEAGYHQRAPRK